MKLKNACVKILNILTHRSPHCLWCTIPSSKLAEPPSQRGSFPARSLDSLEQDHSRFLSQGKGNLKLAKNFNNVIGEVLFHIPLSNVS